MPLAQRHLAAFRAQVAKPSLQVSKGGLVFSKGKMTVPLFISSSVFKASDIWWGPCLDQTSPQGDPSRQDSWSHQSWNVPGKFLLVHPDGTFPIKHPLGQRVVSMHCSSAVLSAPRDRVPLMHVDVEVFSMMDFPKQARSGQWTLRGTKNMGQVLWWGGESGLCILGLGCRLNQFVCPGNEGFFRFTCCSHGPLSLGPKNPGSFSLITGLSLKNKAISIRKSQDYCCLINSTLSSSCILKWCFIRTPFCSGYSIFWAYICIWPLVTFTSHYTMPSLMTDVSSKDRLIIFNIFISFFGTHFPSIQTLHNFNEFHILLGHVGIIHSVQREFEAQRDLCQKILINFGYSLSSLYIF